MTPHETSERIRSEALRLGFDRVAFTPAGPCRDADLLRSWLARGCHGDMAWMERTAAVRSDPGRLLPGTRSVVALLTFYYSEPPPDRAAWVGRVSRYAWGRDYHNVLGRRLRRLARFVRDTFPGAEALAAVDARPVLEKEWAERAGLGWIGKHSNLITTDRGSWFFLSELLVTIECAPTLSSVADHCGRCTACLDACPTGAIVGPREVDARRCLSYLTIEFKGVIPLELRPAMGEWIFGCDICQDVCPWNRFASPVPERAFHLDGRRFDGDLAGYLALDDGAFRARFQGSPVRRAGRDAFVRNVCVALGNRGDEATLPALGRAMGDGSALVRRHAAWAVGRIGGAAAVTLLDEARSVETDDGVLGEIDAARAGARPDAAEPGQETTGGASRPRPLPPDSHPRESRESPRSSPATDRS